MQPTTPASGHRPDKPIDAYEPETEDELPGLPPVDPPDMTAAAAAVARPEVAELDFVGAREVTRTIPLEFPFLWEGGQVDVIVVRRLRAAELGEVYASVADKPFDLFDVYARMTGFSAPVLRGLIGSDGERVTGVAYDFLPPSLKADA